MLSDLIAWYLFLGGGGAGIFLILVVLEFLTPAAAKSLQLAEGSSYAPQEPYRAFFAPAYTVSFLALVLGAVCLLADLGRIDRVILLLLQPNPSYIAVGVFVLMPLLALSALFMVMWLLRIDSWPKLLVRVIQSFGAVVALAVMLYTGLLLQSIHAVALWGSWLLPVVFLLSSLSAGFAFILFSVVAGGSMDQYRTTVHRLLRVDSLVILPEAIILSLYLLFASFNGDASEAVAQLVTGRYAIVFWVGVALIGLTIPFTLELWAKKLNEGMVVASSVSVLIGAFCLRWCIAGAGTPPDLINSVLPWIGLG